MASHHDCQAVIHLFAQPLTKPCDTFDVKAGLGLIQDEEFAGAHEGRCQAQSAPLTGGESAGKLAGLWDELDFLEHLVNESVRVDQPVSAGK